MRNRKIKTTLLLLAALGIVVGIFQYSDTVLTAPQEVEYTNKHIQNIDELINKLPLKNLSSNSDPLFYSIQNKIDICSKEKFITSNERDELVEKLANQYLPPFLETCYAYLRHPHWEDKDNKWMQKIIFELKMLSIQSGKRKVITDSNLNKLDEIDNAINTYYRAQDFLSKIAYVSISDSKSKIATANDFKNKKFLCDCTSLISDLNSVGKRLNDLHFAMLKKETHKLDNYIRMSERQFDENDKYITNLYATYRQNAMPTYSTITNMEALDNDHIRKYLKAKAYYEQQREARQHKSSSTGHSTTSNPSYSYSSSANRPTAPSSSSSYTQYEAAIMEYIRSHTNYGYQYKDINFGKRESYKKRKFLNQFSDERRKIYNKDKFENMNQLAKTEDISYYVPFTIYFKHNESSAWGKYTYIAFLDGACNVLGCYSYIP